MQTPQSPESPEATSLLGKPLMRPPVPESSRAKMEADAAAAWDRAKGEPSADNIVWAGRRIAYLGKFREAIEIYSGGMRLYPTDARLFRHRGHRYITTRRFEFAIADLEQAAALVKGQPDEVEPDGQPNARNIPTSTLHSNIWYHLALARYLMGDFARAAEDWTRARDSVKNPDNLVAASHWLYTSLGRAGRAEQARAVLEPIRADLDVIENGSYHSLLLLYKGERKPDDLLAKAAEGAAGTSLRYGISAWQLANGQPAAARKLWDQILAQPDWPSFGYVAAEAEVARLKK